MRAHGLRPRPPLVVVAGNPNSGKSTLFNALSGARARVANYPGVTVDRRSATVPLPDGREIELTDLPGTYSLSARSREEQMQQAYADVLADPMLPADAATVVRRCRDEERRHLAELRHTLEVRSGRPGPHAAAR